MLLVALVAATLSVAAAHTGRHSAPVVLNAFELTHVRLVPTDARRRSAPEHVYDLSLSAFGLDLEIVFELDQAVQEHGLQLNVHEASGDRQIAVNTAKFLVGRVKGHAGSYAHGTKTDDGSFDGVIHMPDAVTGEDDAIFVEPRSRYASELNLPADSTAPSSVVFRASSINQIGAGAVLDAIVGPPRQQQRRDADAGSDDVENVLSRARRAYPTNKVCGMALVADWTYILRFGGIEEAFNEMVYVVNEANLIYQGTTFANAVTGVSLNIVGPVDFFPDSSTSPWASASASSDYLPILQTYGASNGYSGVCLGHLFVHANMAPSFDVGLSNLAVSGFSGGICDDGANGKIFNVGWTTSNFFDGTFSRIRTVINFAHEVGHSFGAVNDNEGDNANVAACNPSDANGGLYIMTDTIQSGSLDNNDAFSSCSITDMSAIMTSAGSCFTDAISSAVCDSNPCANGGTCHKFNSGFYCQCATGFRGTTCGTAVGATTCASDPCANGGTCIESAALDSYVCYCPSGVVGDACETVVDECVSSPCQNGGTCTDGSLSFTCACDPGYTGTTCETDIDECGGIKGVSQDAVPLATVGSWFQRGGSAGIITISGDTATVTTGPSGSFTYATAIWTQLASASGVWKWEVTVVNAASATLYEMFIGIVDSSALTTTGTNYILGGVQPSYGYAPNGEFFASDGNTETVVAYGSSYTTGDVIGVSLDVTSNTLEFLLNGASQGTKSIVAASGDGYVLGVSMGVVAQQVKVTDLDYCLNGATCVDDVNGVTCVCPSGYTGSRCDSDIDECSEGTPCQNGGTCTNSAGSFSCACPSGFEGDTCDPANVGMTRCRVKLFCESGTPTITTQNHEDSDNAITVGGSSSALFTSTPIGTSLTLVDLDAFGINHSLGSSDFTLTLLIDGNAVMDIRETRTSTTSSCQFQVAGGGGAVTTGQTLGSCTVTRLTSILT